eukprot:3076080-Rhodomonas_salina.3
MGAGDLGGARAAVAPRCVLVAPYARAQYHIARTASVGCYGGVCTRTQLPSGQPWHDSAPSTVSNVPASL